MRKVPLVTNQIYHIFNRGVNKGDIFFLDRDYKRFLQTALHYKTKTSKFSYETISNIPNDPVSLRPVGVEKPPRVQIFAYCLMPNHFHFLIKQLVDGGITSFLRQLSNSYSHYVNIKHKRIGPLFQGRFKNILIESQEQFLHVSRYIHLNPLVTDLIPDLKDYSWSSYLAYISDFKDELVDSELVLANFKSKKTYEQFVLDQADYGRTLEQIKHLTFDE